MSICEIAETTSNLEALADTAAVTFYDNYVKYGLGKYPKGGVRKSRNWKRFEQLARICLSENIPIEKFVEKAFIDVMSRHSIVTVQDICKCDPKRILKKPSSTTTSGPKDLWNLLSCKLLDMVFSIEGISDKTELLDSSMYGFPAWFRVFSPHEPVQKIIVHWGDLAYDEMLENPDLDSFLAVKRPLTYKLLKSVISKI